MNHFEHFKSKIFTIEVLQKHLGRWRFKNQKIAFTNGCFDILHPGHVHLLSQIADVGARIIIGLNSDESVKNLNKGNNRPLQDEHARSTLLAAFSFVDAIVLFDEPTPENLIRATRPDFLVKGGDYRKSEIVGSDFVESYGGQVLIIPFLEGHSTTNIEKKMNG